MKADRSFFTCPVNHFTHLSLRTGFFCEAISTTIRVGSAPPEAATATTPPENPERP